MSRKDIIVVSVLFNVGVLILLFVSSIKPSHGGAINEVVQRVDPVVTESVNTHQQVVAAIERQPKEESQSTDDPIAAVVASVNDGSIEPVIEPSSTQVLKPFLSEDFQEVKVERGDVLGKIAQRYQVSVEEIKRLNNMSSNTLQIGQVLFLPKKASGEESSATSHAEKTEKNLDLSDARYYVVKNGDSPWTIAMKNHIKLDALLELNQLDDAKAKRLKPGDRLRIR